jgi:predicted TIM-barrel fold metal-dependent hydrolase
VFGPAHSYPFAPERNYSPLDASPTDAAAFLEAIGFARIVLVQPTPYGEDDRRLLDALREFGSRARGVIAARALNDAEIRARDALGVTALRLNAADRSVDATLPARIADAAALAREADWHLEVQAPASVLVEIVPVLERCAVPVVLDHLGRLTASEDPVFDVMVAMMREGRLWTKLSGADRFPGWPGRRTDVLALMRALLAANPARVVWGSDWPHTPFHSRAPMDAPAPQPFREVDVHELLALLDEATGDRATLERVLVENPIDLYRFPA